MKCAIYNRTVSESSSAEVSVQNQISFFENYIKDQGWELYNIYSDISSGTTLERPGIKNLMSDAKNNKFEAVLVPDLSRIARFGHLTKQFKELLENKQIKLLTLNDLMNKHESGFAKLFNANNTMDEVDYSYLQNKRCAIYVRLHDESATSNQILYCEEFIKIHNLTLCAVYSDIGSSMTLNRGGIQNLLSDAKKKKFDVVLVKELSRISRNGSLTNQFLDTLGSNKTELLTLNNELLYVSDKVLRLNTIPQTEGVDD